MLFLCIDESQLLVASQEELQKSIYIFHSPVSFHLLIMNVFNSVLRPTLRSLRGIHRLNESKVCCGSAGARFLCSSAEALQKNLAEMVKKEKVVVFMKGTPAQPMCGFSNAVVQILRMHGVDQYASYNVLDDQELRQGVKTFSSWPTIPQIFFNGEFVGGCDILLQMHQSGDLVEELEKLGIRSALLDQDQHAK